MSCGRTDSSWAPLGALIGTVLGLVVWLAYRPSLEQSSHHLIGVLALPWVVVAAAIVLAIVATYLAASRPARSITRLSVVAALSGRPAPPKQVHRSALPGIVFLVIAFLLLGYSGSTGNGTGSAGTPELVLGIVALIPAIILLAPFFLVGLGRLARHAPVAVRLALRDLARYRARSASALAAIGLGVMIAVIIATLAQARYSNVWDPAGPNLASNQADHLDADLRTRPREQVSAWAKTAARVGAALGAQQVAALELAEQPPEQLRDKVLRRIAHRRHPAAAAGVSGIRQSADRAECRRRDLAARFRRRLGRGTHLVREALKFRPSSGNFNCTKTGVLKHPVIQELGALPTGVHAPNTLITEHAVHELGDFFLANRAADWVVCRRAAPLTATEIHNAQAVAATAGLSIETKNDEPTSSTVVNWATVFGIAIALCILAMSVGLIRSETANDLRTLAATGASSYTRRTLTAATAGALGLLGAVLGTFAGYVGVIGWLRGNSLNGGISALGNVPVANLLVILLGLPLWRLRPAGCSPAASHRPSRGNPLSEETAGPEHEAKRQAVLRTPGVPAPLRLPIRREARPVTT